MAAPSSGLQNERTALSWQRTALSLGVASAAISRLTFDRLGALSLVSLFFTLPLVGWVLLESRARYRRNLRGRGGRAPAALTVAILLMASTELAALFMH